VGNEDIMALLVHYGADLDIPDDGGETALIKAVRSGQYRSVGLLLASGADYEIADYTGQTPHDHARRGRDRRIEGLFRGGS
jgi:ankyrin repeat protein